MVKQRTKPSPRKIPPVYRHPEIRAELRLGANAITAEEMKDILGWEAESEAVQFGDDYLFKDLNGVKVRLRNNDSNRPFELRWALELAHNYVLRNWADSRNGPDMSVNGESFVINRNGTVTSGQHRGVGLVLAEQILHGPNAGRYEEAWPEGRVSAEFIIVYGTSDNPRVSCTLDNVKPRSLKDVLFADQGTFSTLPRGDRAVASRACDYALRLIRARVYGQDAYKPRRTHQQSIKALGVHPRVKDAVMILCEEAKGNPQFKEILMPGTAAGFLYLMGCSASDGDKFHNGVRQGLPVSEHDLDWSNWDEALRFWRGLFKTNNQTPPHAHEIRKAIAACASRSGAASATGDEVVGIIVKAWNLYIAGDEVTQAGLRLRYHRVNEVNKLIDFPTVGGIDLGAGDGEVDTAPVSGTTAADAPGDDPGDDGGETLDDLMAVEREAADEDEPEELTPEELERAKAEARQATEQAEVQRRQRLREQLLANRAKRKSTSVTGDDPRVDDMD